MKKLGTYKGLECFECSLNEYYQVAEKGRDDGSRIFIVNGDMVKNNVVIGYYDGRQVEDFYDGRLFVKPKRQEPVKMSVSEATGVDMKEINYADYSRVVDDFFANLPDPSIK